MTITLNTDHVVAPVVLSAMVAKAVVTNKVQTVKANRAERKYERKIRKSQEKLAETTLVPGYITVIA